MYLVAVPKLIIVIFCGSHNAIASEEKRSCMSSVQAKPTASYIIFL